MIFVFTDDLKATNRSAVSFSTAGYPGGGGSVLSSVKIGFLLPQAHDDRWPAGVPLRQVRRDHFGHGGAAAQSREGRGERTELRKSIHHGDQTKSTQSRSIVVHYQPRFAANLDEAIDGEVGERIGVLFRPKEISVALPGTALRCTQLPRLAPRNNSANRRQTVIACRLALALSARPSFVRDQPCIFHTARC